jgi:hypothetical protein
MRRGTVAVALGMVLFLASLPAAQGSRDIENDPLLQLYHTRLKHAEAQKRRQVVRLNYARAQYVRARRLLEKNAMSPQEFERAAAWYEGSQAKLEEIEAHVEEAHLLLRLCRNRLADGKDMPIIPLSASVAEDLGG